MSYHKCTIKQVIGDIDQRKLYLPAIQRKFVWGKMKIELLFDSIMRNYPIGSFLFWKLDSTRALEYVFYEFLTAYDVRNPYNHRKTGAFTWPEIFGVLDGQQRLSSMYIGLMGTHTEKRPYSRSKKCDAYPKMALYLNLLSLPYTVDQDNNIQVSEELNFEFAFLDETDAKSDKKKVKGAEAALVCWFKVGSVLEWNNDPDVEAKLDELLTHATPEQTPRLVENRRLIRKTLTDLHTRLFQNELINYFEISKSDLEDILKIFVRVNSGGTVLSKTDLLFSTIVATWDDGRDVIESFQKEINELGDGFRFDNEFLMRSCLVLTDCPVLYKVNSFKAENVQKIRDEWLNIAASIKRVVELLVEWGFDGSTLTSQNAIIILAYYIYKGGGTGQDSKNGMRKYLIHALLNNIFGSSQDQLITLLRNGFRLEEISPAGNKTYAAKFKTFSFEDILTIPLPQQKHLTISEDDLERFLSRKKGPATFSVLTLLYPNLRYNEVSFHQDHIHPDSGFCQENFKGLGLSKELSECWLECKDQVPNLQLMEGRRNESKNATRLADWLNAMSEETRDRFKCDNYFPTDTGCDFSQFTVFFNQRKEIIRNRLREVLVVASNVQPSADDETEDEGIQTEE